MELAAKIIFFGALASMILWIFKLLSTLSSPHYRVQKIMAAEITIGIGLPIILFFFMAISAGVAWG